MADKPRPKATTRRELLTKAVFVAPAFDLLQALARRDLGQAGVGMQQSRRELLRQARLEQAPGVLGFTGLGERQRRGLDHLG